MVTSVRPLEDHDRVWVRGLLAVEWGSIKVVSLGPIHDASQLPGFLAERGSERVGLITYSLVGGDCEVVTLNSFLRGQGVGSALLEPSEPKRRLVDAGGSG